MKHVRSEPRLPRSGNAALAAGALIQAALGAVFVVAGLSKAAAPDYIDQFKAFVEGSAGAPSFLVHVLLMSDIQLAAQLARSTELIAGTVLMLGALEVARRRLSGPIGAQHGYEPLVALGSAAAAFVLGGMSLVIYVLQGGRLPSVNPDLAFVSPIAIELLLVPLALGVAWLELGRFLALRSSQTHGAHI
jgi:hypothetical protein